MYRKSGFLHMFTRAVKAFFNVLCRCESTLSERLNHYCKPERYAHSCGQWVSRLLTKLARLCLRLGQPQLARVPAQQAPRTQPRSLPESLQLARAGSGGSHHAVVGADAGQGAAIRVIVEAAVGIAELDPGALGFLQLLLAFG